MRRSPYHFSAGAPAPYRASTASSIGGKQVGAGFLTTLPARRLLPTWTQEQWCEARFAASTFFLNGRWIHGATFYGYATRADTTEVKQKTDELLACMVYRILHTLDGPRFIMGDFNQEEGQLTQTAELRKHGWQEAQLWAAEHQQQPVKPTCRSKTTKDFIWLSPEMLPHIRRVVVDDLFPDHSHVWVELQGMGTPEPIQLWRKPKQIQWKDISDYKPEQPSLEDPRDNDEHIRQIAKSFEDSIDQHLRSTSSQSLLTCQRGRSNTTETKPICPYNCPIKPSRHGDIQPNFHGQSVAHHHWYRQLRRLESITRVHAQTVAAHVHRDREWRAIIRAQGFQKGFVKWWETIPRKLGEAPPKLTAECPSSVALLGIKLTVQAEFDSLEQVLIQERMQKAKQARKDNPNRIFADVRAPPVNPVVMLDKSIETVVVEVDLEESSCTISMKLSHSTQTKERSNLYMQQKINFGLKIPRSCNPGILSNKTTTKHHWKQCSP